MRMMFLDSLQDAEQGAGPTGVRRDGAVGVGLLFES
jgi:hypothetical protein